MSINIRDMAAMGALRARADACRAMIHQRAVTAYWLALGGTKPPRGAGLDCCVIHNSLIARDSGRPWPEVDYSAMRECRRLLDRQFGPDDVLRRLWTRKLDEDRAAAAAARSGAV